MINFININTILKFLISIFIKSQSELSVYSKISNSNITMSIKIPAGTRMYLTKKRAYTFFIQPDTTLLNDSLYVAYDVRINGVTVIPRGTRVTGDWVTESTPVMSAQLQINKIYLSGSGQVAAADSDVYEALSSYNNTEVNDASYLYTQLVYRSTANVIRRIVREQCQVKVLLDDNLNTTYLEIFTKEIPVIFISDFVVCATCPC
jgi:hypothetical protein